MKFIKYAMAAVAATCLAMAGPLSAQTATTNSIESIVAAPQGDNIAVKIDLREALTAPPTGFSVAKPAKIAFDFPAGHIPNNQPLVLGVKTKLLVNTEGVQLTDM